MYDESDTALECGNATRSPHVRPQPGQPQREPWQGGSTADVIEYATVYEDVVVNKVRIYQVCWSVAASANDMEPACEPMTAV